MTVVELADPERHQGQREGRLRPRIDRRVKLELGGRATLLRRRIGSLGTAERESGPGPDLLEGTAPARAKKTSGSSLWSGSSARIFANSVSARGRWIHQYSKRRGTVARRSRPLRCPVGSGFKSGVSFSTAFGVLAELEVFDRAL